jgi:hypothetical protein
MANAKHNLAPAQINRRSLLTALPAVADLAAAYTAAHAEGQRLHDLANANGDDPAMLEAAYAEQDRARALAQKLAATPAKTADDVLRKVAALMGDRYVVYPGLSVAIAAEAKALVA